MIAIKRARLIALAREMAATDYDALAATNGRPDYQSGYFLTNYPTKAGYVREWWEERYLPIVKARHDHS